MNICHSFNYCVNNIQNPNYLIYAEVSREAATDLVQSRLGPLEKIARVCVGHVKASIQYRYSNFTLLSWPSSFGMGHAKVAQGRPKPACVDWDCSKLIIYFRKDSLCWIIRTGGDFSEQTFTTENQYRNWNLIGPPSIFLPIRFWVFMGSLWPSLRP